MTKTNIEQETRNITQKNVGGKEYIVKSVFIGDKDVKNTLLKLAERKAIKEMGLDNFTSQNG